MEMCDLLNHRHLYDILKSFKPSNIIHYAEQPSAPYSMMGRELVFLLNTTMLWEMLIYCLE